MNDEKNTDNFQAIVNRFHYLTQDLPEVTHQELVQIACENGIRWIQLRVKNKPMDEWLQIAKEVKAICDGFQTVLIINDNVEICKTVNADGVHLGKDDMSVAEARNILGRNKIIGGTANSIEDVIQLENDGADYIGLGPYKYTITKKNLSPVLGIEGYHQIIQSSNHPIKTPIIAIGGIQTEDVQPLLNTGVYGIAVSSAINLSENKQEVIKEFISLV
ncbi:MAG: thiamine phosphate synthase [Chitinophagales bacterium]